MNPVIEILLAVLIAGGGVFGLIGSWGLLRLPDPMQRLHGPTKATTLGVGAAILASNAGLWAVTGRLAWQELLIPLFLFLTAPLSALMLAKVHIARTLPREALPRPPQGDWATEAADPPRPAGS